uniref:Uncharacterized protein n=1 Tax=Lotus japonicus TaxID=34305 RepID=I3SWR1_LOTJA|nr:unknown [Lotus japonicus]
MLATHSKTPVVSQTSMIPDFLEPLQIIPELHVEGIGDNLMVLAILVVLLPVEEPIRDLELLGIGNNSHHIVQFRSTQLTSSLVHVDISLLATDVGESPSNTLDGGQSKHDLLFPINVGIQHTQNVLEILVRHKRHVEGRDSENDCCSE